MSTNLVFLTPPVNEFEEAYLAVRKKEGRLYDDALVKELPYLPSSHPQAREWSLRQENVAELVAYLGRKGGQQILDLGCGNGWLTQRIAGEIPAQVLGMDINQTELEQAHKLFQSPTCRFAYGDIFAKDLQIGLFDTIVLASCAQYFPDLPSLLNRLLSFLEPDGEIHLLDSPIYSSSEIDAARQRTDSYYREQKVVAMQQHYHHHSWEDLDEFAYEVKYQPTSLSNRLRRKLGSAVSPFPWLIIRHAS